MTTKLFAAVFVALCCVGTAGADPWKDESGHGKRKHYGDKHKKEWKEGETPWWQRGKGYWDGHFKHGRGGPPPWSDHWDRFDYGYDHPRVRVRIEYDYPPRPDYYYERPYVYRDYREWDD